MGDYICSPGRSLTPKLWVPGDQQWEVEITRDGWTDRRKQTRAEATIKRFSKGHSISLFTAASHLGLLVDDLFQHHHLLELNYKVK